MDHFVLVSGFAFSMSRLFHRHQAGEFSSKLFCNVQLSSGTLALTIIIVRRYEYRGSQLVPFVEREEAELSAFGIERVVLLLRWVSLACTNIFGDCKLRVVISIVNDNDNLSNCR